ncbi:PIG-L family deacetylase [Kiritimatiellaeota bacterium B1221]|nr:PIG-L family deacetylase [Kiritimatiellaeota bacterium B1221]
MNPYLKYVKEIEASVTAAKGLTVSGHSPGLESSSKVLLFMPHPDDECIIGLLPLRLMREANMQIINIPVTFGSNPDRQAGRAKELADACGYLGWDIHKEQDGFDCLTCDEVVSILKKFEPEIIFFPHASDWNSRHISTHKLIVNALKKMERSFACKVVETEYWGAMDDPNLMVEGDAQTVADLMGAISLHVEEVSRNPYHLLLPGWMQDNVRRGGELVGGQGEAAPEYSFATLYRLRKWENGGWVDCLKNGVNLGKGADQLKRIF